MSIKTVVLKEKLGHIDLGPAPTIAEESVSYEEVLKKMREDNNPSAIICREGKIAGIFTERDVLNKYILEKVGPKTPIGKLMTPNPVTVTAETTLGQAAEMMHESAIRNLPLVDAKGRPQGLLTVGQIIRYLADHFPAEVMNLPPVLHQISSETEGA